MFPRPSAAILVVARILSRLQSRWERLTPEQQNRRLVLALAERVKALEPQKVEHGDAA